MFADYADEGLGGAGETAVAAVDEPELAPKIHTFDSEQLDFAGFHVVLRKTLADERNAGVRSDEALDHADAGQLHGDVNARAIGTEEFIEHLTGETGARKDERLFGNFGECDLGAMSAWAARGRLRSRR